MGNVKVIDVNGVSRLLGERPGAIVALAVSSTSMPGRYAYRKLNLPTDGKNGVSPAEENTVTPSLVPVYV